MGRHIGAVCISVVSNSLVIVGVGVCGVPDWEIDGLRLGFFALLLTNATDSLGHYVPQNADLGALFAPYFTANSTVVVPSIEGSYQGPEDIREVNAYIQGLQKVLNVHSPFLVLSALLEGYKTSYTHYICEF